MMAKTPGTENESMDMFDDDTEPAKADESEKSLSLMSVGAGVRPEGLPEADALDFETSGGKKLLSHGTLLILLVAALAVGGIFLMRLTQTDKAGAGVSKDVEAKIEQALAKLANSDSLSESDPMRGEKLNAILNDTDAIVAMFSADATDHQVPIEYVQKNPFELPLVADTDVAPAKTATTKTTPASQRRGELEKEVAKLSLQSVMGGKTPVAIIDGELLKVGQTVGSFTVAKINSRSVVLKEGEFEFTLTMKE